MKTTRGALQRAIDILFLLESERRSLDVAGMALRLGIPESSVYRILRVLRDRELVERDPVRRGFRLGSVFLRWGSGVQAWDDIVELAAPILRSLAQESGETAHLTLLNGNHAVTADLAESPAPVRVAPARGRSLPLHCGAAAKVILAHLPESRWRELIATAPLASFTHRTITNPGRLRADLQRIRGQGFAITAEEVYEGGRGVAAPVFGANGAARGSLAISGPVHRFRGERLERATHLVKTAAKRLSDLLGHQGAVRRGKRT